MKHRKILALLGTAAALAVAGASAAKADFLDSDKHNRGGYVLPCSLDGVNPAVHPGIFGNPAVARSYGFVLGPDRVWHVAPNCRRW
jgi:hypothetical protein